MAQHTPGPWREFQDDESHDIMTAEGWHVARIEPVNSLDPEGEQAANARLIAAAPDLLDVARMLVGSMDASAPRFGISDCVMRARAAIAKAEGRS